MKNELTTIKKASFPKRILALIMDGTVSIFTFFSFFVLFSFIGTKAFHYNEIQDKALHLEESSNLYVKHEKKERTFIPISDSSIDEEKEFYLERTKAYYLQFKTSEEAYDYNVPIDLGNGEQVIPVNYYTEEWFNEKTKDIDTKEKAKEFAYNALVDFSKYLSESQLKLKRIELFVMILPSFTLSFSLFYIILPLVFKNGETLGKKAVGICLISFEGYSAKKKQIVLRQLFLLFYVGVFSLAFVVGPQSFIFLGFGVFVYFLATFISKTNRSFADFIAYTYMIDAKNSVWFDSEQEEQKKDEIVTANLDKYNQNKEENKNIIQIGSRIVDEDAKKEFLESQKRKKDKKEQ